jgi:hypothetical protein
MKKLEEMDSTERFIQSDTLDWIYRHLRKSIKAQNKSIKKLGKPTGKNLKFFFETYKIAKDMRENLTEEAWEEVETRFKLVHGYAKEGKEIPLF